MITALDLNDTFDYTCKEDKENPTVWKLGILPSYIFAKISTQATTEHIESAYKLLQVAVKGWENFGVDYRTEKIKLFGREIDAVPFDLIEKIPINIVTELSVKVMEINQLSDDEAKN